MPYPFAVFDMDGTILDTLDDLANSLNYALSQAGFPMRSRMEVRSFLGYGRQALIARGVPEGTSADEIAAVSRSFEAHYALHSADCTRPYPGVLTLLQALRDAGCKTAVVSNKGDEAVRALCRHYFPGLFDAIAGARDGVPKKPAPDLVEAVLSTLHADKSSAVYIGDSEVDLQTAQNSGLPAILVDWGFRDAAFLQAQGGKTIVSTPEQVLQLILK